MSERGYMLLNRCHDLPNNASQAPAAVKIGVTLLFIRIFLSVGAAIFSGSASHSMKIDEFRFLDAEQPGDPAELSVSNIRMCIF